MSSLLDGGMSASARAATKRSDVSKFAKDPVRYKTVLCNKFQANGKCPYGPRCQFAHGPSELRCRPVDAVDQAEGCRDSTERTSPLIDISRTSPPKPREPAPSPAPPRARYDEHLYMGNDENLVPRPAAINNADDHLLSALDVTLDALGHVVCRRNASHTPQIVRRSISSVLNDDADAGPPKSLQNWSNPFGFGWMGSGPLDGPIEQAASTPAFGLV